MASEFGILYTDQIYEQTLEKTSCDVIVTKENAVKRVEIDGVLGYEWGATNHRLGLCEIEHVKTISEFMYEQIKCEGAYPVFPHYVIDALKYNKVIERNDNQVRVDRDDVKLQKIKIQPYFGEAFFSPETYSSTFCKRQAIRGHVAKMRTFAKDRIDFEESSAQTKYVNGNKVKILEVWKGQTDARMLMEGQREKCVAHEVDPIYQLIKKMRYGMMYPTHYMLSQRYRIISERRKMEIEKWLLEKIERGVQRGAAGAKGNESLARLEKLMQKEELENSVIENVIRYGSQFSAHAGEKTNDIPLSVLIKYCESLTTFVHKKNREGGDNQTARDEIRKAMVHNMPTMNHNNPMKVTKNFKNFLFFAYLDGFKRNNGVDINPNNSTWIEHKKKMAEKLKDEQQRNQNRPMLVLIDGVYVSTSVEYGTVTHWVDWVVDIIMTTQVERMIKEYDFKRLERKQLISGMNKLEDGVKCYAYCLILALYDYYGDAIEGFAQGTRAGSIVETISQMFPEFRSDVAEKFGIKLTIKDESEELFVQKDMNSEFLDEGEMGYKFVFGWKNTDFKVQSNYGEIVSEEVERLFKVILEGKEWSNEVEDPEDYFVDNLFNKTPDAVFERDGVDGSNRIIVKNKTTLREGQRHFSARFVSYWYTFEKVEVGRMMARIDIHDRETKFSEFDVDDYKPCSVAEMGLHSSTYIYQDLLIGSNRGEHVIDAKELVWYDIALTNYGTTRYFDQCWPSSCSTTELSMRYFLITEIFQRYRTDDRSSFADILEKMRKNGYPRRSFLTYKHYYVAVIQEVFGDQRPVDVYSFCTDIFKKERRRGILSMFPTFSTLIKSEKLIDALFLNFLLWVVFEMENVDISFANKRHPLLISHDKGLRLIGVDLFNSTLSISMGGWIPYVERICHADHVARKLNADELKIKRWFIDYYMDLSLDRRAEPRMSFKYEGLATWVGSNCGGVRDYIIQELPMRKPKPGLLMLVYGEDGDPKWVEWAIKDFTQIEGSLGFIYIDPISVVNKSTFRTREMKIYNRGRLDRLILISSGNYTFGNKFLLSKLLSKAE
ncbi:major outer capsid protein [African horse sickness virus 7]|uniref:Outer capsid protein VP2 n=6 Tax=African horse sickness virus TaxID=40050 RepID=A0A189RMT0_AHSV7|nr:major outer capsid protein [African horse sickness virus 7]ALM00108.1 major outer capsid protein [African horse sickness virus 7]